MRIPRRYTAGLVNAEVPFSASGFSGSHASINGRQAVVVRVAALARVAVQLGHPWRNPSPVALRRGALERAEVDYRSSVIKAFLETPMSLSTPVWSASAAYLDGLESSEKGGVSYLLGMLFAVAIAEQLLGSHMALHTSTYGAAMGVEFVPSLLSLPGGGTRRAPGPASAPDLLLRGRAGRIHTLEAKGRSGLTASGLAAAMGRAMGQAQATLSKGSITGARVGSVLSIASDGPLAMEWQDPPGNVGPGGDVSEDAVVRGYYDRVLDLLGDGRRIRTLGERQFATVRIPSADLRVGLDLGILEALADPDSGALLAQEADLPPASHGSTWDVGGDGVAVELGRSWLPGWRGPQVDDRGTRRA